MSFLRRLYAISPTVGVVVTAGVLARFDRPIQMSGAALALSRLVGGVTLALGLFLRVWATWAFWSEGGGTPLPPYWPERLVTTGPYGYSRNPLYLGILAIGAGVGLYRAAARLLLGTVGLWALLQWVVVPAEERRLEVQFGEAYRRYRSRVPRWLW